MIGGSIFLLPFYATNLCLHWMLIFIVLLKVNQDSKHVQKNFFLEDGRKMMC
jgi:hypothetical protein